VRVATTILWVQIGALAVKALIPFWQGETYHVTVLGKSVLVLAAFSFLVYKIANRRNWARVVYTGFAVVGLVGLGLAFLMGTLPFSWVRIATLGVTIACLVLLHTPKSREWFSNKPESMQN
jgi:hypothetical protein